MLDALVSPAMAGDVFAVAACAPPARKQRDRSAERSRHRLGTREARRVGFVEHGFDEVAQLLVGLALFGINADAAYSLDPHEASKLVDSIRQPNCLWSGVIRSVEVNGAKFFVLLSVSKLDSESA